jgi:hypothetical protein
MISIVIPSKNEIFLKKTIEDVLIKSVGAVEIFPVLDGYDIPKNEYIDDPRVKYVKLELTRHCKKRHGINLVLNNMSKGKYVMSLDAHCMLAHGWDEVLLKDLNDNEVVLPRRHRLDAENWCLQNQVDSRPPIDYEYIQWPLKHNPVSFHGFKWDSRTLERWNIPIDETMLIQGSFWLMHKTWFQKCGFMDIKYQGWGSEGEEVCLQTYKNGGRVLSNKNTYFAHLHKGAKYGRMYFLPKSETTASIVYAYDLWVHQNKDFFIKYIERFWPLPGWPSNWEKHIYKN